jgi:RsiW-degrading membrane proteinase PrsW (M82 family)
MKTASKTSPVFWGLILTATGLGLYDFIFRLKFRLNPDAPAWQAKSWLVAGVAALIFVAVILWVDRYERESWKWLALAFLWGALVAPALDHQLRMGMGNAIFQEIVRMPIPNNLAEKLVNPVLRLFVPFSEEISKGLFVFLIFLGIPHEFDSLLDGIVFGAMVGIGFAMVEQVRYLQKGTIVGSTATAAEAFWEVAYRRIFLTGLWSHPMLTAFTGAGLGWARVTKSHWQRWTAPILGLCLAIFIHKNWNFMANSIIHHESFEQAAMVLISPYAILMIVLILIAWQREQKAFAYLTDGQTEYSKVETLRNPSSRWGSQWAVWRKGGFRAWRKVVQLQRAQIELAFLMWHLAEKHAVDEEKAKAKLDEYKRLIADLEKQITVSVAGE